MGNKKSRVYKDSSKKQNNTPSLHSRWDSQDISFISKSSKVKVGGKK